MVGANRRRWWVRTGALACAFWVLATPLGAQSGPTVRAYLSPDATVGIGRAFTLNVEITGTQAVDDRPDPPDLSPWAQYLGSGSQSSMQIINGRTSVSLTLQFRYQALDTGTYRIPPLEVRVGGETLRTEPLEVRITDAPPPRRGGGAARAPAGAADGDVAPEDLFVTAEPRRATVRVGEPLVVEYRIWTRVDVTSYTFTRVPEPEGFWVEDLTDPGEPDVENVVRDGRRYASAVIRRVALVPTAPGTYTIDPVALEVQVRTRRPDPFESFFGRPSLFGTTMVPVAVGGPPVEVVVEPLPEGAPEPFSGVVGRLDLEASLDRDSVAANEAVTLTIRASGVGNIRAVPPPELELDEDFEVFPPEVEEDVREVSGGLGGTRTFTYVLVPRAPGRRVIGPVAMSYFDPDSATYRTARTEPLTLTVRGGVAPAGPALLRRGGVTQLREDIRFIHVGTPRFRRAGRTLLQGVGFWIVFLTPLVLVAGAGVVARHRRRLEGDAAYARGRRAGRVARRRLAAARRLAKEADRRAFYAEVDRALRGFIADRLNLPEAGLTLEELAARLRDAGVDEETRTEVVRCLEACDRARFAPQTHDPEERSRFLERVSALMNTLDRSLGR